MTCSCGALASFVFSTPRSTREGARALVSGLTQRALGFSGVAHRVGGRTFDLTTHPKAGCTGGWSRNDRFWRRLIWRTLLGESDGDLARNRLLGSLGLGHLVGAIPSVRCPGDLVR